MHTDGRRLRARRSTPGLWAVSSSLDQVRVSQLTLHSGSDGHGNTCMCRPRHRHAQFCRTLLIHEAIAPYSLPIKYGWARHTGNTSESQWQSSNHRGVHNRFTLRYPEETNSTVQLSQGLQFLTAGVAPSNEIYPRSHLICFAWQSMGRLSVALHHGRAER